MRTILTISESFDNDVFDIALDIRTIQAFGYDAIPLAVNNCTRLEVASAMNEVYASGTNLPDAVSIGILTENNIVQGVAERLKRYKAHTIVIDPAIISEDGQVLVTEEVYNSIESKLFPLATIITPNPYELELIAGFEVHSEDDMVKAARELSIKYRCAVFVKGFNSFGTDVLVNGNEFSWIPRNDGQVDVKYSYSTALACMLPDCESLEQACTSASQFTFGVKKEEKEVKNVIPFTLNPTASSMEIRPKAVESEAVVKDTTIESEAESVTGLGSFGTLSSLGTLSSPQYKSLSSAVAESRRPVSAPVEKEVEVVLNVDNFAPDPVIDESLSRSLKELRDKLNKLR